MIVDLSFLEFIKRGTLPEHFAEDVLDLEMKIELNKFTMADIDKLIYLYSQAIEHYEGVDQDKHASFYQKTIKLLNKPSVFETMKARPKETKEKKSMPKRVTIQEPEVPNKSTLDRPYRQRPESQSFYADSRKKLELDVLLMQDETKEQEKTNKILDKHTKGLTLKSRLIENDMEAQKNNLEMRLLKRRVKNRLSITQVCCLYTYSDYLTLNRNQIRTS